MGGSDFVFGSYPQQLREFFQRQSRLRGDWDAVARLAEELNRMRRPTG